MLVTLLETATMATNKGVTTVVQVEHAATTSWKKAASFTKI